MMFSDIRDGKPISPIVGQRLINYHTADTLSSVLPPTVHRSLVVFYVPPFLDVSQISSGLFELVSATKLRQPSSAGV